jgi:hypothetical protein
MLLAALFGRKQKPSLLRMLRTGPVQTVHAIPGRVRFRVPSLVGDPSVAGNLRERLSSVEGVREVDVNPATGSVLIQYRGGIVRPELLRTR